MRDGLKLSLLFSGLLVAAAIVLVWAAVHAPSVNLASLLDDRAPSHRAPQPACTVVLVGGCPFAWCETAITTAMAPLPCDRAGGQ